MSLDSLAEDIKVIKTQQKLFLELLEEVKKRKGLLNLGKSWITKRNNLESPNQDQSDQRRWGWSQWAGDELHRRTGGGFSVISLDVDNIERSLPLPRRREIDKQAVINHHHTVCEPKTQTSFAKAMTKAERN